MSLKLTTFSTLFFCAIICGCGTDPTPITSKATKYEVADDPADVSAGQPTTPNADIPGATPRTVADPVASGDAPPRRPAPMNEPPASDSNSSDSVEPTTEQLLTVIRHLREQEPKGTNETEILAELVNLQTQLIQAVDMLLAMKPADAAVKEAATAKIDALTLVSRVGVEGSTDQLFAFIEELKKHPSEKISAFARERSFVALLNAYSDDQVTDAQQVVDAYKELAAEQPKGGGLLSFGQNVASRFIEKEHNKEAADVLRFTAGLVQPTQDPRVSAAADSLLEQATFADVNLGGKLRAVADGQEGALEEFTKMLGELTSGEKVGNTTLQTIMQIGDLLEPEHVDAAGKAYDVLEASISKVSDEEMAEIIKDTIKKFRIRSAIVGKPFALEGQLLDGTPFDWEQYKGKVVLVDFWATWCQPCLQEIPNIRANFVKYRDRGFEVVGVNLDSDVEEFEGFSSLQPLPWPSVLSADPEAVGWDHPMAVRNGVAAIPFLVLVGRDGNAIALNTRGPELGEKLAELFPDESAPTERPAAEPAAEKPAAEKPAAEKPAAEKPAAEKPAAEKPAADEAEAKSETPAEESAASPDAAPSE